MFSGCLMFHLYCISITAVIVLLFLFLSNRTFSRFRSASHLSIAPAYVAKRLESSLNDKPVSWTAFLILCSLRFLQFYIAKFFLWEEFLQQKMLQKVLGCYVGECLFNCCSLLCSCFIL